MNFTKLLSKSVFLLLISMTFAACDNDTNAVSGVDATGQDEESIAQNDVDVEEVETDAEILDPTEEEENVTTEEVAEDTEDLLGQTVTIRSDALEVVEPSSFVVGDQEFFGGENILVVNASGEVFELPEGDTEVQITGEVVEFVLADVESEYDLGFDPDLYVDYEGQPAIIAQSLAAAPEPGEIAEDPAQYYGETLAVTGEIENIYSDNTFTLDEDELFGGEDLLVVVNNPTVAAIQDGETVAVTGELRQLIIADLETDYDLTWDLDVQEQLEAEYSERPVLVVDDVYPSAIPGAVK